MKGLILAAGYGTRFLPVTKSVPKEMLPLIDRPAIAFIIDEFLQSGIEEITIITSRRKKSLEDYFDRDIELETLFLRERREEQLNKIKACPARITFIRQQEMLGTGHALLLARSAMGEAPFVCAYPDDIHFGSPPLTQQLITLHNSTGCSVLASLYDPPGLKNYGVLSPDPDEASYVKDIVEKPPVGREPSRHASIGRYLYTPDFFPLLQDGFDSHKGKGEYYHIHALKKLMGMKRVVHCPMQGERFDLGSPRGYLKALLHYARTREDLADLLESEAVK